MQPHSQWQAATRAECKCRGPGRPGRRAASLYGRTGSYGLRQAAGLLPRRRFAVDAGWLRLIMMAANCRRPSRLPLSLPGLRRTEGPRLSCRETAAGGTGTGALACLAGPAG